MFMPSDSWGKYMNHSMSEDALLRLLKDIYSQEVSGDSLMTLLEDIEMDENDRKRQEEIELALINPNTGEVDYIDIELVEKLRLDPTYISHFSGNVFKINLSLKGVKEKDHIIYSAACNDLDHSAQVIIEKEEFENILYHNLHIENTQRLEKTENFKAITNELMFKFLDELDNGIEYLLEEQAVTLFNGLGIIRDQKKNQDIGTFESIEYRFQNQKYVADVKGIFQQGNIDMPNYDQLEFRYYSLDDLLEYIFTVDYGYSHSLKEDATLSLTDIQILIKDDDWDQDRISMVKEAQEKKGLIMMYKSDHPLYEKNVEEFRLSRIKVLEESRNKEKQKKIVEEFANIDLDF